MVSIEKENPDTEGATSGCDTFVRRSRSQEESGNEHQDPISWPNNTNSMLSRKTTFSSATRKQNNRLTHYWQRVRGARTAQQLVPSQQHDDGAPVDRDAAPITYHQDTILRLISPSSRCKPSSPDRCKSVSMPQFDDLSAYLPAGQEANNLWNDEAARLIAAVETRDPVLPFPTQRLFNEDNENGYQNLARLSEMVLSALSLCLLDNECIYVEFCKPLANRNRVEKLIQQARVSQKNGEWDESGQTRNKDFTLDAIFALVDYISAVLARLLSQIATGNYWCNNVLAVLTQRVTKLKVLLMDMHANTMISCQAGEAALDRTDISSKLSNGILNEEECEEVLRMIDAETKEGLTTTANAEAARYCVDQNRLRSGIDATIRYILLSLRFQNRSGLSGTSFEICGMVYATGFEDFKALLFQDRDLEYLASSDQDALNTAYPAFKILNQTMGAFKPGIINPPGHLQTSVEWRYLEADSKVSCTNSNADQTFDLSQCKKHKVFMNSMEEIITVMIPLLLTNPLAVASLTEYRTMMALVCDAKDGVQPFKGRDYTAFFRMYTNQFENDSRAWDVMRLSTAVQANVFSRCALISGRDPSKDPEKIANKMSEMSREMERWVIDEGSVTVTCKFQVCWILFVAFLIASGGLSIMATGNRITGVDPSNLSTYLWVVAGVYVLVCKSRFVESWPWSDFLHFRVRCRSVSELHAISGINEQFIMAKLLHDERGSSVLKTRGPYNKVFLHQDSSEGFSIDCPLQMTTLLLSGLIMLKVVTPRGHALVCLDARRGTELKVVEHQGNQAQTHLICEDVNRVQDQHGRRKSQDRIRLQLETSKELKWKRVQGVYKDMDAEFV